MTSRKGSNGGHSCNLKKISVQYRRELGQEDGGEEKQGGGEMALICFLKAGDFSSSLNDRHKK